MKVSSKLGTYQVFVNKKAIMPITTASIATIEITPSAILRFKDNLWLYSSGLVCSKKDAAIECGSPKTICKSCTDAIGCCWRNELTLLSNSVKYDFFCAELQERDFFISRKYCFCTLFIVLYLLGSRIARRKKLLDTIRKNAVFINHFLKPLGPAGFQMIVYKNSSLSRPLRALNWMAGW